MADSPIANRTVDFEFAEKRRKLRMLLSSPFIALKGYDFELREFGYNKADAREGEVISAFGTVRNNAKRQGSVYVVLKIYDPVHTRSVLFGLVPSFFGVPPKRAVLTSNDMGPLAATGGTLMLQEIAPGENRDFSATFQVPTALTGHHLRQNYFTQVELWQPSRQHGDTLLGYYRCHQFQINRHRSLGILAGHQIELRAPKIFVAYCHQPELTVWYQQLEKLFNRAGCDVWFDVHSLRTGVIDANIAKALDGRIIVPILTTQYMQKWYHEKDGVGDEKKLILRSIQNGAHLVPLVVGSREDVRRYCPELVPFLSVDIGQNRWQGRPFAELMRKLYDAANLSEILNVA